MPSSNRVFVDNLDLLLDEPLSSGDNLIGRVKLTDGTTVALVRTDGALYVSLQNAVAITWAAPTFATVGATTTAILASNTSRKGAMIVNDSDSIIYLGIGAAAVAGSGIRLNPNGGAYVVDLTNLTTQAINGIASGAGKNVTVHEAT